MFYTNRTLLRGPCTHFQVQHQSRREIRGIFNSTVGNTLAGSTQPFVHHNAQLYYRRLRTRDQLDLGDGLPTEMMG